MLIRLRPNLLFRLSHFGSGRVVAVIKYETGNFYFMVIVLYLKLSISRAEEDRLWP